MLFHGDCVDFMQNLGDNSIDAIVTDPPYGLQFMGKKWDYDVPGVDIWQECLRVLKPGGYLLSFAGTRTYHRMAVNIEDAGFEIRDMLAWVYGSGFPKSHDISKAIDKAAGAQREVVGKSSRHGGGTMTGSSFQVSPVVPDITAPATDAAKQWDGWGTALKPAIEDWWLMRKPLVGTVAANVQRYGTGALNIDGCRVGYASDADKSAALSGDAFRRKDTSDKGWSRPWMEDAERVERMNREAKERAQAGRWPANVIHDGSAEVLSLFPVTTSGKAVVGVGRGSADGASKNKWTHGVVKSCIGDSGSAARFFKCCPITDNDRRLVYCAKASRAERDAGCEGLPERDGGHYAQDEWSRQHMGNTPDAKREPRRNPHPTVKPLALMRYLCRLVTPPGGLVLDPFAGSGSTGVAAVQEGFRFLGIEKGLEYVEIARARIAANKEPVPC